MLILVVDDDQPILDVVQEFLEGEGYQVATCRSGSQCVQMVKQLQPAVVILDLLVEDVPGLTILELIKADPDISATPVLLCSASPTELRRVDPQHLGAGVGLLAKPFELDDLLEKLNQLARDNAPLS